MTNHAPRSAFTLVEMLIVISIISVLLGLLYGSLERAQKYSRRTIAFTELKNIETAFKQYYSHYNAWPSNDVAALPLTPGNGDLGFVIDRDIARALQGHRDTATEAWRLNPEAIPFIEFTRYSPTTLAPVNPFKSERASDAGDTTRSFKVLFDTNGDRQITIPVDSDAPGTPSNVTVIASVAVWTAIPATRTSDASGQPEYSGDVRFGSWDSFTAK